MVRTSPVEPSCREMVESVELTLPFKVKAAVPSPLKALIKDSPFKLVSVKVAILVPLACSRRFQVKPWSKVLLSLPVPSRVVKPVIWPAPLAVNSSLLPSCTCVSQPLSADVIVVLSPVKLKAT